NSIGAEGIARSQRQARLTILLAAVMWSTSALFAKANFFHAWPIDGFLPQRGLLLVFWRAVFATLVLAPLVRRPRWTWKLIPAGLIFLAMNVTYLSAMVRTSAANAIWLQNTAPLWVFLVGTTLLGDPVDRRDWLQLACIAAGLGVIFAFELRGGQPTGVLWGVAAGATYAGVVLSLRWLRTEDSAWLVAFNHGFTALALAPYVASTGVWPAGWQWPLLVAFGMLQMGLPYLLFARGLRWLAAHEAAGIVLLEPLLVPLWALVWNDRPAWWTLAGGGLIFIGLVSRYLRAAGKPTRPPDAPLSGDHAATSLLDKPAVPPEAGKPTQRP
ncbi:MAG: EamA family transporter, partial [Planctomycetales bacterium]|nr:EamA family transporter [Planctomycetales bacterium]